ncbi:MAG TPA: clostripain-related cysteine peptidase [Candidatus Saccharimonadales bacterium]|nr:clostripain-related cysteine peptidase [Candidatus Saccharimonadales bacterium]
MKRISLSKFIIIYIFTLFVPFQCYGRLDSRLVSPEELFELALQAQKEEACTDPTSETRFVNPKRPVTFMVYMAADNDLNYFAWKNLKQMEQIGSNENISIVVQLNTPGQTNPTKRYVVKKGRRLLVADDNNLSKKLNSGSPQTLIDFVKWAVTHYPADEYVLDLWNHGSGDIDPNMARTINPCDLFYENPIDNMLEIDRGTSYITLMYQAALKNILDDGKRGICFDDTFKSYISNHDLEFALHEICTNVLNGNKLGVIGFDACLMSMIGVASVAKKYARHMVSSQEVEYGTGWNYELVLKPFAQQVLSAQDFAKHIVLSYEQNYSKIINDYTMSALDLSLTESLERNIHEVAYLLNDALKNQSGHSASDVIRKCKSTQYCTCFDEPSYIDLGHFYQNLLQHIPHFLMKDKNIEMNLQNNLRTALNKGLDIISLFVIENRVGPKLRKAQGISIYFPEHSISKNYLKSPFALTNNWSFFLSRYILK